MLGALILICLAFAKAACNDLLRMYTRDALREEITNKTYNTGLNLTLGTANLPVTLQGFQNVIELVDIGSVDLDITVKSRKSRFIAFCLWSKNRTDPRSNPIGTRKSDSWEVDCNRANQTSTLEMTNRVLIQKPDGPQ